jgi:hypothetical protein
VRRTTSQDDATSLFGNDGGEGMFPKSKDDEIRVHEKNYIMWLCPGVGEGGYTTAYDRYEEPGEERYERWVGTCEGDEVEGRRRGRR